MKYYEVILIDKNNEEHYYFIDNVNYDYTIQRIKELIEFAKQKKQTIKLIRGKKR